jgi:hypothetical protein
MKFFIPAAKDDKNAKEIYEGIIKFAKENTWKEIKGRKIFSIAFNHDGKDYVARVGEIYSHTGEQVIAILESNAYLVCTPSRGVLRGMPILVGKNEVYSIEDFED